MRSQPAAEKSDEGMASRIFTKAEDILDCTDNLESHAKKMEESRLNYLIELTQ